MIQMMLPLQFGDAVQATEEATKTIVNQGLLGALLIIAIVIAIAIYVNAQKERKELQARVDEVTQNHIESIKEASKDTRLMIEKYNQFANEIKALFHQNRN